MGTGQPQFGNAYRREFWWEREWRHVGSFVLPTRIIVLCPEAEIAEVRSAIDEDNYRKHTFIDSLWSLEKIIARTAGFRIDDVGPF